MLSFKIIILDWPIFVSIFTYFIQLLADKYADINIFVNISHGISSSFFLEIQITPCIYTWQPRQIMGLWVRQLCPSSAREDTVKQCCDAAMDYHHQCVGKTLKKALWHWAVMQSSLKFNFLAWSFHHSSVWGLLWALSPQSTADPVHPLRGRGLTEINTDGCEVSTA